MSDAVSLLQRARSRERAQAAFYRRLSGQAESAGDVDLAERLNELLADEQHHVSRVTARLLELGIPPGETVDDAEDPGVAAWEPAARRREDDEIRFYEEGVARLQDVDTRAIFEEILDSERHHREELGGKWMSAESTNPRIGE